MAASVTVRLPSCPRQTLPFCPSLLKFVYRSLNFKQQIFDGTHSCGVPYPTSSSTRSTPQSPLSSISCAPSLFSRRHSSDLNTPRSFRGLHSSPFHESSIVQVRKSLCSHSLSLSLPFSSHGFEATSLESEACVLPKHTTPVPEPVLPRSTKGDGEKSSKKRMCYYYTQGLCTQMEDREHIAKYSHSYPELAVEPEDLKNVKRQPFDYFLVLDLEGVVEILEFPVLMVDTKTLQVVHRFHRFVRPVKMTKERIAQYIKGKYGRWGLDRVWHDTAIPFADVLVAFEGWMTEHRLWSPEGPGKLTNSAFVTCGNWDVKTKIPEQCVTSRLEVPPYFMEWINLKDIYFNFYKFRATGMLPMLRGLKLPVIGTHHVGLDDSHNIARVLVRMLSHGVVVQITAKREKSDLKSVKFTYRFRIK